MAPFYGWSSTASRLQSHFEEVIYFLPLTTVCFLPLTIWQFSLKSKILSLNWTIYLSYQLVGIQFPNMICDNFIMSSSLIFISKKAVFTIIGVFRTLSNIYKVVFCENIQRPNAVTYLRKTVHLRYLTGFWICLRPSNIGRRCAT